MQVYFLLLMNQIKLGNAYLVDIFLRTAGKVSWTDLSLSYPTTLTEHLP